MSGNYFIGGFFAFGIGAGNGGNVNYGTTLSFVDDFVSFAPGGAVGPGWWAPSVAGGGSIQYSNTDNLHPGIASYDTGSGTTDEAGHFLSPSAAAVADGITLQASNTLALDYIVRLPNNPDGTNTFVASVGLTNRFALTQNYVLAQVIWSGSAPLWRLATAVSGGGSTNTDAATGPTAGNYHTVSLRAATGSVTLYVDGSQVATHSTNIPTGGMSLVQKITKSAGTTARQLNVDLVQCELTLPSNRLTLPA